MFNVLTLIPSSIIAIYCLSLLLLLLLILNKTTSLIILVIGNIVFILVASASCIFMCTMIGFIIATKTNIIIVGYYQLFISNISVKINCCFVG